MPNTSSSTSSSVPTSEAGRVFLLSDGDLYGSLILATLVVYDCSLTFDKEVEFIWNNLRSSTSWIFLLNRYLAMASAVLNISSGLFNMDNYTCRLSLWIPAISSGLTLLLFDYILLQRVFAICGRSKFAGRILFALLLMEFVIGLACSVYFGIVLNVSVEFLSRNVAFCRESLPGLYTNTINRIMWALPLTTGLIFMILSLYKSMQYQKESLGTDGYSLIDLLIRDQTAYFLVVVISSVAAMMIPSFSGVMGVILATLGTSLIPSVIGSRLIINLKVDGKSRANGGTDTGTELPPVQFASARSAASEFRSDDFT